MGRMLNPIVIAYHLVWTADGWWLPNDPRGSGSEYIAQDIFKQLGDLHMGRKQIQPASSEVRGFYERAAGLLKYPLLKFGNEQVLAIAQAFGQVIQECRYTCYACAVMPDHVHILIRKHKHLAEEMLDRFHEAGRLAIAGVGDWEGDHPVFGAGGWKVFLDEPKEIWRTISYIEQNPVKIGLPVQHWGFVTAYDNWPLHPGHSPNSPYARRLRGLGG
jgi:REP element-mobilizing transposase RayT